MARSQRSVLDFKMVSFCPTLVVPPVGISRGRLCATCLDPFGNYLFVLDGYGGTSRFTAILRNIRSLRRVWRPAEGNEFSISQVDRRCEKSHRQ